MPRCPRARRRPLRSARAWPSPAPAMRARLRSRGRDRARSDRDGRRAARTAVDGSGQSRAPALRARWPRAADRRLRARPARPAAPIAPGDAAAATADQRGRNLEQRGRTIRRCPDICTRVCAHLRHSTSPRDSRLPHRAHQIGRAQLAFVAQPGDDHGFRPRRLPGFSGSVRVLMNT